MSRNESNKLVPDTAIYVGNQRFWLLLSGAR